MVEKYLFSVVSLPINEETDHNVGPGCRLVIGTTNGDEAMDECILKVKAENMKNEDPYNRIKTILID